MHHIFKLNIGIDTAKSDSTVHRDNDSTELNFAALKGQFHEILYHFLSYKILSGPRMNRQKRFREIFRFREDICENLRKNVCPRIRCVR